MEVEYDLTPEDLTAFQRYHRKHPLVPPKQGLQAILGGVIGGGVVLFGFTAYYTFSTRYYAPVLASLAALIPGAGVGFILALIGLTLYARLIQSHLTRKALQEGRNAEKTLGWRRLSIDPHALRVSTPFSSIANFWEGVDAVVATRDYVFVYISTRAAHVVPRRAFLDDRAFDDFVEMARRYRQISRLGDGRRPPAHDERDEKRPRPRGDQPPAEAEGIVRRPSEPEA